MFNIEESQMLFSIQSKWLIFMSVAETFRGETIFLQAQSQHALVFWPFVQSINYLIVFKLIYTDSKRKRKQGRVHSF